ncbi:MAG TPA: LysR family transcriptional regulator, partial [Gammaproteobacteria bacterium]|nr:LysR family transcriptional regulator [Gammaproteobacteria bacterium]
MAQLNYNHLHYFWVVATLGSIVKAAQALHVTPQTISGQLRTLEERVGSRLFRKQGRRLQLTDTGQLVRSYAEPMFHLGVELVDALRAGGAKASGALRVGITPSLPRCVASRVLGAVLGVETRLVCHDAASSTLAADLAA